MAIAIWNPGRQEGELVVVGLPALAPDKSSQLWTTEPGNPVPASAGVIPIDPAMSKTRVPFKSGRPVPAGAAFTVSVERSGGAASVEGPIVLSSH